MTAGNESVRNHMRGGAASLDREKNQKAPQGKSDIIK